MEQLNGFELAGRNIRVISMDEADGSSVKQEEQSPQQIVKKEETQEGAANSSSRLQLMANLAKGLL